jgi:D-alanyl-D-alanine dipeptidase
VIDDQAQRPGAQPRGEHPSCAAAGGQHRRLYRLLLVAGLLLSLPGAARAEDALVDVRSWAPGIRIDLRYAGTRNRFGEAIYDNGRCFLRESVARRLATVEKALQDAGFGLLLWDCYRPTEAQARLWELTQDTRYVANPKNGSRHGRGAAVDVTLIDANRQPLTMPTDFDDFSPAAHRDAKAAPEAAKNREHLRKAMEQGGFVGLRTEWWHFDAPGWEKLPRLGPSLRDLDLAQKR